MASLNSARRSTTIFHNVFAAGLIMSVLTACGGVDPDEPAGEFVPPVVEWQIVFEDEFDGTALDTTKWNIDTGDGCPDLCGWGNNELQSYEVDNVTVSGGTLKIEGRRETDGTYTSGRINTQGKFDFQYGRVEISARIPAGQGIWPAIWMMSTDPSIYGPWPLSGEIDIMEAFNYGVGGNTATQSTTHYGMPIEPYNGTFSTSGLAVNADLNFHEFAMEWEKDKLRFYIDGQHYQTQNSDNWYTYYPADEGGLYDPFGPYTLGLEDAPFDQLFYLLINFAIGGNPVGDPAAGTVFPQTMEVDYVRVYECVNANPGTGRGCGTADAAVVPLEDLDGGPLQDSVTAQPYIQVLDLYLDGPETIRINIGEDSATNVLSTAVGFAGPAATVVSDPLFPDPDDAENTLWHVSVAGDVANVLITGEDKTDDPLLDTGFNFSGKGLGGGPYGEVVFDMQVNSITEGTSLFVKLDSGFPNLGELAIPTSELVVGDWKTYSIKFEDLLENPGFVDCCGGTGVDLENVVNPFVFEVVGGDADVYLDNIRVTNACYVVGACKAAPKTKGVPDFIVFDDAVNAATWNIGIAASDSGTGFTDYTDGTNPANKVNWAIIDDVDVDRGKVIDVTFNNSGEFGVWFISSSSGVDMNAFSSGAVVFDIIVDDYGNNTNGMTMKVDCFFPCGSGDKNLGVIADGVWETVVVPVSSLTQTGLDLDAVNTGIVVFPTSQSGTIRFRLDNIRWVESTDAQPLEQIDLPVTFDDSGVEYALTDFGGASSSLGEDPDNSTNKVAVTVKTAGAETFAGTVIGTSAGFATPIPFTDTDRKMSMLVYSAKAGVPVLLKVENDDASIAYEVTATTAAQGAWENMVWDFSTVGLDPSVEFTRAIVFFDFGTNGDGSTYLWDNVAFGEGGGLASPITLPVTFNSASVDYELQDFGGTTTTLVSDPDNAANTVASTIKGAGSEVWAGTTVANVSGFAVPIPFSASETVMTVRVWSPTAGIPVLLKVEDKTNGAVSVETLATTTVAGAWETLQFDFTNNQPGTPALDLNATYDKASVFFNFGTSGDGSTYLWDDIAFVPNPVVPVDLPVTFDNAAVDYELQDFGGTTTQLLADPVDAANTVASTVKGVGSEVWAGTTVANVTGFANPIPFTAAETTMTVRVMSPAVGIPVLLKVEDTTNGAVSVETLATTTTADTWETLTFDFSNEAAGTPALDLNATYDKASIFFNFGTSGDGSTYLWDDVEFVPLQVALPVTFEVVGLDYELQDFGGTTTTLEVDPTDAANTVASTVKGAGSQVWAGTTVANVTGFAQAVPFTATDTTMTVRVWSPTAGIPVLLKVEDKTNGAVSVETLATTTTANAWETLTFDFSNEAAGTPALNLGATYDKASIFFNFGTSGDGSTYLWDDVAFGANP